ncbi:phosphocholine-specific phospholipase C [Planctomicrobium sp. SH527]|uniref:phosphocholine-specific phospholipase C n=1 Tax=Planctomicrobium sp. SH527 TaxID=3448123 RepID=UPI003F5CB2A7
MQTRRHFLQDIAMLAGAASLNGGIFESIKRASAIEPEKGSSYLDAEHVVVLMQENRSFDHMFGTLQGVRGFNDPRAVQLADGNPAWVQTNPKGEKFVPFHLDIKETKSTWMGTLPHGWADQVDAANGGKHDRWLEVKKSGYPDYAAMPLTLGYHTREDIPFYYALADAFTVCDQNFCSTLTGTTPNRLHLWTGTVRETPSTDSPALVRNEDCQYGTWTNWKTFPERLEENGISWRIYQNELDVPTDLSGEPKRWLSNYGDNPIEWFTQYHVRFHERHRSFLNRIVTELASEIQTLEGQLKTTPKGEAADKIRSRLSTAKASHARYEKDRKEFTAENYEKLTPYQKAIHEKAFSTNTNDPDYLELDEITYQDGDTTRTVKVPKGDVLHQFRKDVSEGKLPTVSWLVPPERFSDHPSSAWYGQWYLSEVLNILTQNPEVWKKTIFILTYDENDGYYDHVPPFQVPHPTATNTGKTSEGLDTTLEFVELEQDRKHKPRSAVRGNSMGLGFRVPMVIASPWSRGGCVYSHVTDHTSVIQFLEKLLSHRTGKTIEETNITDWRRAICGDLTTSFQREPIEKSGLSNFVQRDDFIESIHRAQFKKLPEGFHPLSEEEVKLVQQRDSRSPHPEQESGTRRSCPLPYQIAVDGRVNRSEKQFAIQFKVQQDRFQDQTSGVPFIVYSDTSDGMTVRHYAVAAGKTVSDSWNLDSFQDGRYSLRVYGPNGFYREFRGSGNSPELEVVFNELNEKSGPPSSEASIQIVNHSQTRKVPLIIRDLSYGVPSINQSISATSTQTFLTSHKESAGWYDVCVTVADDPTFQWRYAGRAESGNWGTTDPAMAGNSKVKPIDVK